MSGITRPPNMAKPGPAGSSTGIVIRTTTMIPDPPRTLDSEVGAIRWVEIATILVQRGTWSMDWIPALEHLCREYDNLSYIDAAIAEDPTLLSMSVSGKGLKMNPLLEYRLKIEGFIQAQLAAFGLTPGSCRGSYKSSDTLPGNPNAGHIRVRNFGFTP